MVKSYDKPYCTQEQADAAYAATCKMAAATELFDAATGALDALESVAQVFYGKRDVSHNALRAYYKYCNGPRAAAIRQLRAAIKKAKGG